MRKKNQPLEQVPILNAPIRQPVNVFVQNNSADLISFNHRLIKAQMIYSLASYNWTNVINQLVSSNFSFTPELVDEISKELNEFFIKKLQDSFNLNKNQTTNNNHFSESDIQILRVLINQIKSPKNSSTVGLQIEQTEEFHDEYKSEEVSVQVEQQTQPPPPQQKPRVTISNNPHRKPMPSPEQQRVMDQMEANSMAKKLGGIGFAGFSSQPAPSVLAANSPANQNLDTQISVFDRDPNQM